MTEFMEKELVGFRKSLECSESLPDQYKDEDEEDESMRMCRKSFQEIVLQFMRKRNQDCLANMLQISKSFNSCLKVKVRCRSIKSDQQSRSLPVAVTTVGRSAGTLTELSTTILI